jgi:hypothetical protein
MKKHVHGLTTFHDRAKGGIFARSVKNDTNITLTKNIAGNVIIIIITWRYSPT